MQLCGASTGAAQVAGEAGGTENVELGAVRPSAVEMHASARPAARPVVQRDSANSGTRLALQLRLDALNTLGIANPQDLGPGAGGALMPHMFVPVATPGIRLLDARLFVGLGLGFGGVSVDTGPNNSDSRSGFSFSPLFGYDLIRDDIAAFSLLGWFNLASLGETERCRGGACVNQNDDAFGIGLNVGVGLRGLLSPGLALGGEFGWGFLSISNDPNGDMFFHGIFGTLTLEASIGI
jgi:hypothetical protein